MYFIIIRPQLSGQNLNDLKSSQITSKPPLPSQSNNRLSKPFGTLPPANTSPGSKEHKMAKNGKKLKWWRKLVFWCGVKESEDH